MNPVATILAAFEPLPQWANFLAIFAVIVLSAFAVFLWAVMFRRKRKRKYHRQHREQRKLNPTLAESGGLPPPREEKKSDAPTPPP
jgi:membrane protein implicated in regulation of membrane protease activity